jgi:hypothetical protein
MSTFLPYREDDGNVYLYEWETNTLYKEGEIIASNNVFYRVEKSFVSGTSISDDFNNGVLSLFNKLDLEGTVYTVGPVDANVGRGYGNNTVNLIAPADHMVIGYRMYGNGANNYPDGGSTGSSFRHWMFTKKLKKE